MLQTLQELLSRLCAVAEKSRENEQQAVFELGDAKDAKLAYDVVVSCGIEAKIFPQDDGNAKIYIEKATLAPQAEKIAAALHSVDMLKDIKQIIDQNIPASQYSLSYTLNPLGRQLTLQLPHDKTSQPTKKILAPAAIAAQATTPSIAATPAKPVAPQTKRPSRFAKKDDKEEMLQGPSVARQAVPKYLQTKEGENESDSTFKMLVLLATGRAMKSGAWFFMILLIFGIIFSIIVTVKGFLCPDFVTVESRNPSYCPRVKSEAENALENRKPQ
jgi:hypothetical protein